MFNKDFLKERFDKLTQENVINFIMTFIKCEYIYKTLYRLTSDTDHSKEMKLNLMAIKKVFNMIGYHEEDTLELIFGSSKHSYRQLRNAIVHKISRKAIRTIDSNHIEYIVNMNRFIEDVKKLF